MKDADSEAKNIVLEYFHIFLRVFSYTLQQLWRIVIAFNDGERITGSYARIYNLHQIIR